MPHRPRSPEVKFPQPIFGAPFTLLYARVPISGVYCECGSSYLHRLAGSVPSSESMSLWIYVARLQTAARSQLHRGSEMANHG